jgi:hypothetical protein
MRLRLEHLIVLLVLLGGVAATGADAGAAELPLEQRCIAAGLVPPLEYHAYAFNHHPEKDREVRASENFISPAEVAAQIQGVIAELPEACRGHFHREGQLKLEFKASKGSGKWHSLRAGWEEVHWYQKHLPPTGVTYTGEGEELSPFATFEASQNDGTLGLGCALKARARIKLAIVDDATGAIDAVRFLELPIAVDQWYQARCLGKFSIQDVGDAHRCSHRPIGAAPGGKPLVWGVKAEAVGCGVAVALAQEALEVPAYSQAVPLTQMVNGWRCFYATRPAVACLHGAKHVYMIARGGVSESCGKVRGVTGLSVAGTTCDVATELAAAARRNALGQPFSQEAGGVTWSCAAYTYLEYDDYQLATYHCFFNGALVTFKIKGKERVVPVEPQSIPPEVVLPSEGPASLFALTPELKFGERAKWTPHKVFVPIEVEPALVGQVATVEVVAFKAKCEWTNDEGQTSPICPSLKRVGRSVRQLTLQASQLVLFAPRKNRGNWIYRMHISTKPFSFNGLSYRKTGHLAWAEMINEAAHCERNPWCHRHHK